MSDCQKTQRIKEKLYPIKPANRTLKSDKTTKKTK